MRSLAIFLSLLTPLFASAADKPNVIFILADDLGWGDLGCYGHPQIRTPNLDRLARQGTLFTQFYVNGSVCSPSRAAFMTGQFPARLAMHGHLATHDLNKSRAMPNWLDPKTPVLPRLLQKAGYVTGHFGKWHLGNGTGAPPPSEYGFDDHRVVNGNGRTWDEPDITFRARSTAAIVDEAIRFMKAHPKKPFYLNLWTLVPHATLNPTEEQLKPYANIGPGGPKFPHKSATQIFYASVTDLDTQVGRLMKALDEMKLADQTLVLFSSDNGPEDIHIRNAGHSGVGSAGPFRGRKRSLYEGGVRVPGIVRWPGKVPAGRIEAKAVFSGVDWVPTVCGLAGVKPPAGGDGEDLGDVLQGKSRARKDLMWEWRFRIAGDVMHHSPMLAIREGDWKLLVNPDGSRAELYDIPRDATQLANVAEKHPDVVKRLQTKVIAWSKTLPEGPRDPGAGQNTYRWPGTFIPKDKSPKKE